MKKLNYFSLGMLAAAATFSACSSSDEVASGSQTGETTTAYLTININNTDGTRADGDYEVGSEAENEINSLYLYFYDEKGTVDVGGDEGKTYRVTATSYITDKTNLSSGNVEEKFTVELKLKNGVRPTKMIVVANSDTEPTNYGTDNQTTINTKYNSSDNKEKYFVMSSSTYLDENKSNVIYYTTLTEENFSADKGMEAKAAEAYIERVLAKVKTTFPTGYVSDNNYTAFELTDGATPATTLKYTDAEGNTGNTLKAQIIGWNVVYSGEKSYLSKKLTKDIIPSTSSWSTWNDPTFCRSYWAITPALTPTYPNASTYTQASGAVVYPQEYTPASTSVTTYPNLLVVAQLLDKEGKAFTNGLCYYNGEYIEGSLTKTRLAKVVNNRILIASDDKGSSSTALALTNTNIKLGPKNSESVTSKPAKGQYEALATYAENATVTGYYSTDGGTKWTSVTDETTPLKSAINNILKDISVLYYNTGYTYYFTPIKHLNNTATELGAYGLVRNHVYNITISMIAGTGTPMPADPSTTDPKLPDENIYPETPDAVTTTYMKARINVLSWRIVNNSSVVLK